MRRCVARERKTRLSSCKQPLHGSIGLWPKALALFACALHLIVNAKSPEGQKPFGISLLSTRELSTQPTVLTQAQTRSTGELLIVEIDLNGVRKGEFTVIAGPGGDFFVNEPDLRTMDVAPPYGAPVNFNAQVYYSMRALQPSELRFDEAKLVLFLALPPERLPKKALDLLPEQSQRVLKTRDNSAFFNYNAQYAGDNSGGPPRLALSTELGVRVKDVLLRSESTHTRSGSTNQNIRYATSLTQDNRDTSQRWIFGDFSTTSGDLGGFLNLGGISFSKSYQIDPYFIRQPMASFTGNTATPSQAEIYLDGVRVRTAALPPGQFEMRNLNYYGGQREVTIVLRDRFGREQTLAYPFYFTDSNLRQGLHDYSYNIGFQRQNLGTISNDYGKLALSAFHRYGVSDSLTLGGRGEAEFGRSNVGATASIRSNVLGVVSSSLSAGRSLAGSGWAGIARYAYQVRQFSVQTELRRTSPNYETVGQAATADRPKTDVSASASYGTSLLGNLSISMRQLRQYQGVDQSNVTMSYSRTLFDGISLLASIGKSRGTLATPPSTNLFFALNYSPRRDISTSFSHSQRDGIGRDVAQLSSNTPVGEGLGYRIVGERSSGTFGNSERLSPSLQYNGTHGVYTADLTTSRGPDRPVQQIYQLGVGGSIAYVDQTLAFSRPVTDSFGIVKVGSLEGVRVYQSAQEIGRTDAAGKVFLPNLGSYVANRVAIDDRDIPINYVIANKELNISPPLRSGSIIRFDVMRIQAITGRISIRFKGQVQAAEYVNLFVTSGGKEINMPTGLGGEFYIENLEPGRHDARFMFREQPCAFELTVPASEETIIDLGELNVCQFSP